METIGRYLEHSPSVFFKWRNESGWPVEFVSGNVSKIFGYSKEDFLNRTVRYEQLIHPDDLPRVVEEVIDAGSGNEERFDHLPYRILTREGELRWVEDTTKIERDEHGSIIAYYGYITDITSLEQSREELHHTLKELRKTGKEIEEYRRVLDAGYIVSTSDPQGIITSVNDYLVSVSGYSREELIGRSHSILRHPSVPKQVYKELWETITAKKCWHGMLRNRTKDGKSYFVKMTIIPILDENGEIEQYIAVRYDMTRYMKQQEQIKTMAFRSITTGLPNLYALVRDIDKEADPVLAMINIDGFKVLNNLYGYRTGDSIIKEMTKLLSDTMVKAGFTLYHIHADEFAVLGEIDAMETFLDVLKKFQEALHTSGLVIHDKKIPLHVSIACSKEPKERLLISCNMAMHYARSQHERFVHYNEQIDFSKDYHDNLRWTTVLHDAINDDTIVPFFQPIYDVQAHSIRKFEALMRIRNKDELFSPALFLDIAKKVKLYPEISMIMLEKTFEVIRENPYTFSINLSVEDIMNPLYTQRLFELLQNERKGGVILEIVESEGIDNFDAVNRFIEKVKALSCRIAIDDFGTGYSNFEYLLKLNADYLKIDGSLIKNIDTDSDAEDIVRTIVSFAKKKNIPVIAEMVASEPVLAKIVEIGIEYAQGYYIGRALPKLVDTVPPHFSSAVERDEAMIRLIYVSRAQSAIEFADAKEILDRSWHNNRAQGISGVLIYDGTYFIQCLEGPKETVEKCYERIRKDKRHYDVSTIAHETILQRRFKDWTMSYVGHHVYMAFIPKYAEDGVFNPYGMKSGDLLNLLDEIHKVA